MADKYQVTLIFIDEPCNHQKALPQIGAGMYSKVVNFNFDKFNDLVNFIEAPENKDDSFLLFIHVFREDKRGHKNAIKNQIARKYPNLKIHWITSDKPESIAEEIGENRNVFKYDEIPDMLDDDNSPLKPIKLSVNEGTEKESKKQDYIFISHSTEDKDIVNSFRETILQLGLGVPKENIFCSSNYSTGIPTGEDIPDKLKEALQKMTLCIQYISENYKKSEVCLNEMGAAWLKLPKSKIIAIKTPDISFKEVGFLNIQRIGLSINNRGDLLKLFDDYKVFFPNSKMTDLSGKIDEFLESIKVKIGMVIIN